MGITSSVVYMQEEKKYLVVFDKLESFHSQTKEIIEKCARLLRDPPKDAAILYCDLRTTLTAVTFESLIVMSLVELDALREARESGWENGFPGVSYRFGSETFGTKELAAEMDWTAKSALILRKHVRTFSEAKKRTELLKACSSLRRIADIAAKLFELVVVQQGLFGEDEDNSIARTWSAPEGLID